MTSLRRVDDLMSTPLYSPSERGRDGGMRFAKGRGVVWYDQGIYIVVRPRWAVTLGVAMDTLTQVVGLAIMCVGLAGIFGSLAWLVRWYSQPQNRD